jgi:spore coat polysaccharide biosynthesis protein SpsF
MKTVAIIASRLGSSRLPAKALLPLDGVPLVRRVVAQVQACPLIDEVVVATAYKRESKYIEHAVDGLAKVYYGNEDDVLQRYFCAALMFNAEVIVRVTGDCPLWCPVLGEEVIAEHDKHDDAAYTSNVWPTRTATKGHDTEVFSYRLLDMAHHEAVMDHDREHVTPYIQRIAETVRNPRLSLPPRRENLSVDTIDDYLRVKELIDG